MQLLHLLLLPALDLLGLGQLHVLLGLQLLVLEAVDGAVRNVLVGVGSEVDLIGEVVTADAEDDGGDAYVALVDVLALDPLHEGLVVNFVYQEGPVLRSADHDCVLDVDCHLLDNPVVLVEGVLPEVVGGLVLVPHLPAPVAVADGYHIGGVGVAEVGGPPLRHLNAVDGPLLAEVYHVEEAQVVPIDRHQNFVVVGVVGGVEDGRGVPLHVQHDVVHVHALRLHQQQLQLPFLLVGLLGLHHFHHKGVRLEGVQVSLAIVALALLGSVYLVQSTVLASQQHLFARPVPAEVVNLEACFEEAIGGDLLELGVVEGEEEEGPRGVGRDHDAALPVAFDLDDGVFVDLEGLDEGELFLVESHEADNAIREAHDKLPAVVLLGEGEPVDAGGRALGGKLPPVELLAVAVVEEADAAVLAGGHDAVVEGGYCEVAVLSRVELKDQFPLVLLGLVLPEGAVGVLHDPVVLRNLDPVEVGRLSVRILEVDFLLGLDVEVELLVRLAGVDGLGVPEADEPVRPRRYDLLLVVADELNRPVVAGLLGGNPHH